MSSPVSGEPQSAALRIDVVSIFPQYFAPLELSLVGKAVARGLIDVSVRDLRQWTTDVHHSVDDTPYGGGAGMVMRADVWGTALDEVITPASVLIIPTPAGELLTQARVQELSQRDHLVMACGRYEGIDARVAEHYRTRCEVLELSLGDYVLNGGEVAALALIEAVVRLVPGVIGNADSLVEESHGSDGLLEYPSYTKPVSWRGLAVPEILLSGHHRNIMQWRAEQALARTRERRPDLLN